MAKDNSDDLDDYVHLGEEEGDESGSDLSLGDLELSSGDTDDTRREAAATLLSAEQAADNFRNWSVHATDLYSRGDHQANCDFLRGIQADLLTSSNAIAGSTEIDYRSAKPYAEQIALELNTLSTDPLIPEQATRNSDLLLNIINIASNVPLIAPPLSGLQPLAPAPAPAPTPALSGTLPLVTVVTPTTSRGTTPRRWKAKLKKRAQKTWDFTRKWAYNVTLVPAYYTTVWPLKKMKEHWKMSLAGLALVGGSYGTYKYATSEGPPDASTKKPASATAPEDPAALDEQERAKELTESVTDIEQRKQSIQDKLDDTTLDLTPDQRSTLETTLKGLELEQTLKSEEYRKERDKPENMSDSERRALDELNAELDF